MQYALWDSDYNQQYEIASLTKTMTSSLLIDTFRRGKRQRKPASAILFRKSAARREKLPSSNWHRIALACRHWPHRCARRSG
ncbi:hypothetical protein LNO81_31445 [Klebsiella variicola subsp. variicola]|nr:hypothetical protein [Klebsiella variicola subsp. variicola]